MVGLLFVLSIVLSYGVFAEPIYSIINNDVQDHINSLKKQQLLLEANTVTQEKKLTGCQTIPVKQSIKRRGCLHTSYINHVCLGQCKSFTAPESLKSYGEKSKRTESQQCLPGELMHKKILLFCPGRRKLWQKKKILFVASCNCMKSQILHQTEHGEEFSDT